ncbi:unnamed protein product [Ambrosiozyma monospora]|uniref:Unnamed protein product n=1 Tax=Ambrosiozyma monospora TaxID=43982 RepID=A0A9W6YSJ5_AMBMO|nr:unnamed protein product [Ambrosiozyma monospora]
MIILSFGHVVISSSNPYDPLAHLIFFSKKDIKRLTWLITSLQSGANPSQAIISQILETEAKERLSRVRLVKPERVQAVENYLVKLYQSGAVRTKITEDDIVEILEKVAKDERRGNQNKIVFNRREVSYGDDDDDDDFFD